MSVLSDPVRPAGVPLLPADLCRCQLTWPHDGIVLFRITGEVDLESIGRVEDAVRTVLGRRPEHVVVDLAGMGFCGLRGLALLVTARATAAGLGIGLVVCGASVQAVRVWSLLWEPAQRPPLHPDAATAVREAHSARKAALQHRVAELPLRIDVAEQGLGVG